MEYKEYDGYTRVPKSLHDKEEIKQRNSSVG